jgi:hypothetical protein
LQNLEKGIKPEITRCVNCLSTCNPKTTPYCISQALIASVEGDVSSGLIFAGSNAYRTHQIVPVHDLMVELTKEAESYLALFSLKDQ